MYIKLYILQLKKLKLAAKNATEVTLMLSSNMIGNFIDDTSFRHKLLVTDRHVSKARKTIVNNSSGNVKLSKTHLSKIV